MRVCWINVLNKIKVTYLTVPAKRKCSCKTTLMPALSCESGMVYISTPPTKICPYERPIERMRLRIRVDFPEPVLPTTPTFYPYLMLKLTRWRTLLLLPRYLAEKPLNYIDFDSKGKGVGAIEVH